MIESIKFYALLPVLLALVAIGASPAWSAPTTLANSWLPDDATKPGAPTELSEFLQSLAGTLRPLVCQYNNAQLLTTTAFAGGTAKTPHATWSCQIRKTANPDSSDLALTFKLRSGTASQAGIAMAIDFSAWSKDNYIIAPGQIYGGNRFRIMPIGYPPYLHNVADRPLDMPVTTTNILHLNADGSPAKIEMNTGNLATPMLGFFNPGAHRGFILLTQQNTRFGNTGMIIEEDASPQTAVKRMSFVVSAPGVRSQRYTMCGRGNSPDRGADWKPGDEVTLQFKLYNFACANLTEFYAKLFDVRKALSGNNSFACVTPYSAAAAMIIDHFDRDKWFDDGTHAHYCNTRDNRSPFNSQIGWNGIPIYSYAVSLRDSPEHQSRVAKSLDFLTQAQAPTGLFYAMLHKGNVVGDWGGRSVTMTRRTADVVYFGIKQLELLKQRGQPVKPEWEAAIRKGADGLVKVWNDYGQFGQFIDADTGKMQINGSTNGIACTGALAIASKYFHNPGYLKIAEASGKLYHERDFAKGYAGGGAAEILQSPDSQAPWDGGESYMALYDVTGNPDWLKCAMLATTHLATWMVSYDYQFPQGSAMAKGGTHAAGSIFASSQNNHSAPGMYILSGDFLLKLFRATGDPRVAAMYRDTAHNVVQYVGAPFNPLRKESGFVTERVQLSDWEGGDIGSVSSDTNMAWETLAALSCLENPGIYLRTDADTLIVMDHVDAKVLTRDATGVTLEITNPTKYDAQVSILAESAALAKKPLASTACVQWPKIAVNAGETRSVNISPAGKLTGAKTQACKP